MLLMEQLHWFEASLVFVTTRQRELSEAPRLFTEMGATARAERIAKELAATAGATPRIPSTNRP